VRCRCNVNAGLGSKPPLASLGNARRTIWRTLPHPFAEVRIGTGSDSNASASFGRPGLSLATGWVGLSEVAPVVDPEFLHCSVEVGFDCADR